MSRPSIGEVRGAFRDLQDAAARIQRVLADLSGFARPRARTTGRAGVVEALEWALRATEHEFRGRARLVKSLLPVPPVAGGEGQLEHVFLNLLSSAAQAIAPGDPAAHQVRVSTSLDASGRIAVEVAGARGPGKGTSLGLAICHDVVRSMGGELIVESVAGRGTLVRVVLPPVPGAFAPPPQALTAPKARVLAIDDEELVLRALKRVLRGHELTCVGDAQQALALFARGERFDVVLCDLTMPVMSGMAFYEALLQRFPDVAPRVVFLSGGAIAAGAEEFLSSVRNLRLEKPFETANIRGTIASVLGQSVARVP